MGQVKLSLAGLKPIPGVKTLAQVEKQAILAAMRKAKGDKFRVCLALDIGKTTLYRKLEEYGGKRRR